MELFARCGIIPYSKRLLNEAALLRKSIDSEGICQAYIDESFFEDNRKVAGNFVERQI